MLLGGGGPVPSALAALGIRIQVAGSAAVRSPVPLGYLPSQPGVTGSAPVLLTGDAAGLAALPGLTGVYRTYSWLAPLALTRLRGWQLAEAENRLARAQGRLLLTGSQFSLSAPFTALDEARAQASAAPQRLELAGGGAIAVLALFIVLAGGGLRRDQRAELDRLQRAGARPADRVLFVAAESGGLGAAGVSAGAAAGLGTAALLASVQGEPAGAILHLIAPAGVIALAAGWLSATVLLAVLAVLSGRLIDTLAVAALSALIAALAGGTGGDAALALLLAPPCCACAGVLTFRAAGLLLRGAERLARPRSRARPPRAGQPGPVTGGTGAGYRVRRRRGRPGRFRPGLPGDADPQRGGSGGGPGPARRARLGRAGFQPPAHGGSAAALAGAGVGHRAACAPDGRELPQRRGDGDRARAWRARRRADPAARLAGQ